MCDRARVQWVFHPSSNPPMQAQARRARGGICAALAVIRTGSHEKAVEAAMKLLRLQDDGGAAQELAESGTVRALLVVIDSPDVGAMDSERLQMLVVSIMPKSLGGVQELVETYDDQNPHIVCAALRMSRALLSKDLAARLMLTAGFAPALVAALSHRVFQCRVAAVSCVMAAGANPKVCGALCKAGLIPRLVHIAGEDRPRQTPPSEGFGRYSVSRLGDPAEASASSGDPPLMASAALHFIGGYRPTVFWKIALLPGSVATLLKPLEQYPVEDCEAPATLLASVLQNLDQSPGSRAYVTELVGDPRFPRGHRSGACIAERDIGGRSAQNT
eukprot:jgi/Botrbrau1/1881/Bobra.146_1s0067.1